MHLRVLVIALASLLLSLPAGSWAPRAYAQSTPPDVVELANGGIVRGTIVENIPGDHVSIQIVTGEVRTFSAAEVLRVGPAVQSIVATPQVSERAPPPPAAIAVPQRRMARLDVESNAEGFMLHRVTGTVSIRGALRGIDAFDVVCTLPCSVEIEAGTYFFGLSRGRSQPLRWREPFVVEGNTTLSLYTESRGDQRLIGGLVLGGGLLVGGGVFAGSLAHFMIGRGYYVIYDELAVTGMVLGGAIVLAAVIVGSYFGGMRDHVDLRTGSLRF